MYGESDRQLMKVILNSNTMVGCHRIWRAFLTVAHFSCSFQNRCLKVPGGNLSLIFASLFCIIDKRSPCRFASTSMPFLSVTRSIFSANFLASLSAPIAFLLSDCSLKIFWGVSKYRLLVNLLTLLGELFFL